MAPAGTGSSGSSLCQYPGCQKPGIAEGDGVRFCSEHFEAYVLWLIDRIAHEQTLKY